MSIFTQISQPPIKESPDVWIHRVALLRRISPKPEFIREIITLRKGLNIIWAEEPESEEDSGDIAGHSAGKTTFCRILRYALGEKTFSNKANTLAIKQAFPGGYVAAEIYIKGELHAVLRPLGDNRNSYVLKNGTIEQILAERGEVAYQETYPSKLGLDKLLDDFTTSTVVRTNEPIQWGHLLAWCTRDQEARFQNIHDWRSSRSESEWPTFRFPKSDPLFVMRVALGLFLPDELGSEESLAETTRKLAAAESEFERAKREPEFWQDYLSTKLRNQLEQLLPSNAGEIKDAPLEAEGLFPDLKRLTSRAIFELGEKRDDTEARSKAAREQVLSRHEEVARINTELGALRALFKVDSKATEELRSAQNKDKTDETRIEEYRAHLCPYGDVLIGECSHVEERKAKLSERISRESGATEEMLKARAAELAKVNSQIEQLESRKKRKSAEIEELSKRIEDIRLSIEGIDRTSGSVQENLAELVTWTERVSNPTKFEKLSGKATEIDSLKAQIAEQQASLNRMIAEHDENRELLSRIYSSSAKRVLPSPAYDGAVRFQDRELSFQITKKGTMSGEAMETLAVLLGDISCLIFNALSDRSHLPGFMIHDSPREADLGLRLYHSFIRFIFDLDQSFAARGGCPFQYVLTTTTPPPKAVRDSDAVRLQLDAAKESGLLLRTDLSALNPESNLLPP